MGVTVREFGMIFDVRTYWLFFINAKLKPVAASAWGLVHALILLSYAEIIQKSS